MSDCVELTQILLSLKSKYETSYSVYRYLQIYQKVHKTKFNQIVSSADSSPKGTKLHKGKHYTFTISRQGHEN